MNEDLPEPQEPTQRTRADRDYHQPVMVAEVLQVLTPGPGRVIVDGTLGGGGHTRAFLEAGASVIGLDRDEVAIRYCQEVLKSYSANSVTLIRANYRDLKQVLQQLNIPKVDGVFLDIGVSSTQLDFAERGFSFQKDGPLDMRMDQSGATTAADLVNGLDQAELTHIFRIYGEEPAASRVAGAIVKARAKDAIASTLGLARVVESVIPKHGPRHPATRVFQALRMAVNDELGALEEGLEAATERLNPGGRLGVITFHSLEDRIVKNFCRETSAETLDRPEWPAPRANPRYAYRAITRRPMQASPAEQRANPRSRSAKLRALERIS